MKKDQPVLPADAAEGHGSNSYRRLVLLLLLLVYTFNFVDRQILGILAVPVQTELGLSDTQLGLLGGIAFALLYSTAAIPLAWLADRTGRTWVITGSLAVWSGFTALCGLAGGFWSLFLCRLGVGVGEAGGVAPSFSLISDYFPSAQRARALAIYSLGIPLGSALGVYFGGYIAANVDWRAAFIVVGLAGVALAPLFRLIVREPPRAVGAPDTLRLGGVLAILSRKRSFWFLALGAASSSIMGYGMAFWLPTLLQRSFGLELEETSIFFGTMLLLGGGVGVMLGGIIGDRVGRKDKKALATVPAFCFLIAAPVFAGGILSHSLALTFVLFSIPMALGYVWLAPVIGAVQHLVPSPMRTTATASFLFINNLLGPGLGIYILGGLSDALLPVYGSDGLKYAMMSCLLFYVVSAIMLLFGARSLDHDWVD